MSEASTLIRKAILELADDHPGWSATRLAQEIDTTRPDLVDDLFVSRRGYILRGWVTDIVGEQRRETRNDSQVADILEALHPVDGDNRLMRLGEMTGTQAIQVASRYRTSGERLIFLADAYQQVGETAGRRKIKTVFSNDQLKSIFRGAI